MKSSYTGIKGFLDIASWILFCIIGWAFMGGLVVATIVMVICGVIQGFGGHTFMMDRW